MKKIVNGMIVLALASGSVMAEQAPLATVVVKSYATQDLLKPEVQARMSWKSTVTRLPDALGGLPFFRLPPSDDQLEFTVSKPGTVYLAPFDPLTPEMDAQLAGAGFSEFADIQIMTGVSQKLREETLPVFQRNSAGGDTIRLQGHFLLIAHGGPEIPLENTAEHLKRLAEHKTMQRYAANRAARIKDLAGQIPTYHPFYGPEGMMNDPMNIIYWQGLYHFIYQAFVDEDGVNGKGHAVSKDLVHWQDLPKITMWPGFTGGHLVDEDRVVTTMTHELKITRDPLLMDYVWLPNEMFSRSISGPDPEMGSFHDSAPFKIGDRYYLIASSGGSLGGGPKIRKEGIGPNKNPFGLRSYAFWYLFESEEMESGWNYVGDFIDPIICALHSIPGEDGAVHHFHPFGDGQYLLIWASHRLGAQYFIGTFDSEVKQFKPHSYARLGTKQNIRFVAAGLDKEPGVVNVIGQMTPYNWGSTPHRLRVHTQALQFSLDENQRLLIRPAPGMVSLRDRHQRAQPRLLEANTETIIPELAGATREINLEIDPRTSKAIRFSVRRSPGGEESTDMTFYPTFFTLGDYKEFSEAGRPWNRFREFDGNFGAFVIDQSRSSLGTSDKPPGDVQFHPSNFMVSVPQTIELEPWVLKDQPLNLRIFIDNSLVEVFINDRKFGATLVFPTRDDSIGVSITAIGGDAFLNSAESWDMKPISYGANHE